MIRSKFLWLINSVFLLAGLAGCATLNKPVEFIGSKLFPSYSGPKAKVMVADFEIKTVKAGNEIGVGLREMLVDGLTKSNRFFVIAARKDNPEKPASLIIAAELIDFEPQGSGGSSGIAGGGSSASGTLDTLLGAGLDKSYIALNIRIVDASSSRVVAAQHISGQAVSKGKISREVSYQRSQLGGKLSAYNNTPMAEAINKCIVEAVKYIIQKLPSDYYKYKGDKNGKA
ncbi:MAG: hypothetical protein NTW13_05795 [Candidatus Omnitrophica bacterium]|nr:hypothetical protein [Candidatus Omnitrophota bacterium]